MSWFSDDNDGGFLWLVGSILGAVDSDFDYGATTMGMQTHDERETRYVESRRNHKGELNHTAIIETRYNEWRDDNRNVRDIRELNDPYDNGSQGGWLW